MSIVTNPANGADGVGGLRGVRIADALRKTRARRKGGAKRMDFVAGDGSGNVTVEINDGTDLAYSAFVSDISDSECPSEGLGARGEYRTKQKVLEAYDKLTAQFA